MNNEEASVDELRSAPETPAGKRPLWRTLLLAAAVAAMAFPYLWPHSLTGALPDLDPAQVRSCDIVIHETAVENGQSVTRYQYRSIDPASPDFAELIDLLSSTRYRLQLSNLIAGGALGSYSVTLNPSVELQFLQANTLYEIELLGRDIPMGAVSQSGKKDYSAYGGMDFQRQVAEFAASHGTLEKEEIH